MVCVHHVIPPILGYIFWNKEAQFCIDQYMGVLTEVGSIISNSLNDQKFMLKWHAKVYKGLIVSRGVVNDCNCLQLPIPYKAGCPHQWKCSVTVPYLHSKYNVVSILLSLDSRMQAISEVGGVLEGVLGGLWWVSISFGASGLGTDSCHAESWELHGIGHGMKCHRWCLYFESCNVVQSVICRY